jgi:uncharacterized protein (DUF1501 family)
MSSHFHSHEPECASRRLFLRQGALAMLSLGFAPGFVGRAAAAAGGRKKLLVTIFQRGAVDGLNMVVPFGEADYYRVRPSIAIARPGSAEGAIDLNGFFGLHPRMASFKPLWDRGELAIVQASGSHDTTRSHFDAQDYMESATPGVKSTRDGWLNRYLSASASATADKQAANDARDAAVGHGRNPLRAVALTSQMPRTLQGTAPALAMGRAADFAVADMSARSSFEEIYQATQDKSLNGTGGDAFDAMRALAKKTTGPYRPANGAVYPRSPFGQALRLPRARSGITM